MAFPVLKGEMLCIYTFELYVLRFQQHNNYFLLQSAERSVTVLHFGKVAFVSGKGKRN